MGERRQHIPNDDEEPLIRKEQDLVAEEHGEPDSVERRSREEALRVGGIIGRR